jgi:Sec-independent protein translocase protein TatA
MIVIGAAALLFFGPDQLPKVARKVGTVVRDVQLTSQSFIREMERAADEAELRDVARSPAEGHADPRPAAEPPSAEPEDGRGGASPEP